MNAVCTVGGDDECTLSIQETRHSCRSAVAYFLLKYSLTRALLQIEFR